jgi:hypothetical protein
MPARASHATTVLWISLLDWALGRGASTTSRRLEVGISFFATQPASMFRQNFIAQ